MASVPEGRAANQPDCVVTFTPPIGLWFPGASLSFAEIGSPASVVAVIAAGVNQLQAAAAAGSPLAPASAGAIGDFILDHVKSVGRQHTDGIGFDEQVRHGQGDTSGVVGKLAGEIAEGVGGGQVSVVREEVGQALGHDQIAIRRDDCVRSLRR